MQETYCSRAGCVDTATGVVMDGAVAGSERTLCPDHLDEVFAGMEMRDRAYRQHHRLRARFDLMSPLEQYQEDGR